MRALRLYSLALLFLALVSSLSGCGGGSSSSSTTTPPPPQPGTSSVLVNFGDAPVDSIVAFEITITSVTLTPSGGGAIFTVLSTPTRIELTHLNGTVEPLAIRNIPEGSYSSATINVSNPEVKIIDSGTGLPVELNASLSSTSATVNFSPAISFGTTPTALNFDFNLAASVVIAPPNATVTPTFTGSLSAIAAQNEQEEETGEIEDITGVVTGTSGSSFTISVPQTAQNLTFATNSSTEFEAPLTGVASLTTGLIVEVDALTQTDGSLLATKVEAEIENDNDALEVEGLITDLIGLPPTGFHMVVQDGAASGTIAPALGATITVNLDSNTQFRIDDDHVDLNNLPFVAVFNANVLSPGQKVEVDTDTPATDNLLADKVKLKEQTLRGTVSNLATAGSQSTFTLTVPVDSAFALLTGQTTLQVIRQPETRLKGITTIANGDTVRTRGLLFFDGVGYHMVTSRIAAP
ncbi:MAG TPA: DUF5666 domain-containing protein [Terriglobales bacterium]|nr:DUF5666 domain-containing protein [Terriglobales bacterium]